jgi:hypothetical protein
LLFLSGGRRREGRADIMSMHGAEMRPVV